MEYTIKEKAELINLAMKIELGKIELIEVLRQIKKDPDEWYNILHFWADFNNMTRKVIKLLELEMMYIGRENV